MSRTAIDRSKLKVGARVECLQGTMTPSGAGLWGLRGTIECRVGVHADRCWNVKPDRWEKCVTLHETDFRVLSKPRTPIKKVNRPRKLKTFEKNFGDGGKQGAWIRTFPCCVPLCESQWTNVQASHITSQGAGGTRGQLAPMCKGHHDEWHRGRETFCTQYPDTDFLAIAHRLSQIYDINTHLALRLRAAAKSSEEAARVVEGLHVQADPSFDLGKVVDELDPLLADAKAQFEPVAEERQAVTA